MDDHKLENIQRQSRLAHVLFVEVPKGKIKKVRRYTKKMEAEAAFAEREERLKRIAKYIESKL